MRFKKSKTIPILLVAIIILIMLPGLACNLFSAEPSEPEVVEEPIIVEGPEVIEEPQPEEEPAFIPEQVRRIDFDGLGFEGTVHSVAYSINGDMIATGIFTQADIWLIDDGSLVQSFEVRNQVDGIAFLPGDDVIVLSVGGTYTYSIASGEEILDFGDRGFDPRIALSPDGTLIASGNRSGETRIWRVSDGELMLEMDPNEHVEGFADSTAGRMMTSLAFSPDGRLVASGHNNGLIFIWNTETAALERLIEPQTDYCIADGLAFSNDGQILAMGGARDGFTEVIRLFQVSDGSIARDLEHGSRGGTYASPVVFSPDESLFAFGATDGIYIWSLPDYELLHTIPIEDTGETDWVTDLAFSPDSQYLLAGYWNNYAILWQVQE